MEGRKEIGEEGTVQSDEGSHEHLDWFAFGDSWVHGRGKVPDWCNGKTRKSPEYHETNFTTENTFDEMLKIFDSKSGADLEGKQTSTEWDSKKCSKGTGHSHECVFSDNIGGWLSENPTRDKAA